jgi:hypothetical protein
MLVAVAVLGEAAHLLLDQVNAVVAHHFFHIVFPLAAFAVFAWFVANDIRAHGWPTFSWRLHTTASASRPSSGPPPDVHPPRGWVETHQMSMRDTG